MTNSKPWSVRQEIECKLTIAGCEGILRPDGSPLFRFKNSKLNMDDQEFHDAWGMIHPQSVADVFHNHCLDVNPDWDWRPRNGEEENPQKAVESESE